MIDSQSERQQDTVSFSGSMRLREIRCPRVAVGTRNLKEHQAEILKCRHAGTQVRSNLHSALITENAFYTWFLCLLYCKLLFDTTVYTCLWHVCCNYSGNCY